MDAQGRQRVPLCDCNDSSAAREALTDSAARACQVVVVMTQCPTPIRTALMPYSACAVLARLA